MSSADHADLVLQFRAVQEALDALDPGLRSALMPALSRAIREARHDERRLCAKIALDESNAAAVEGDPVSRAVADRIAAAILTRDAEEE